MKKNLMKMSVGVAALAAAAIVALSGGTAGDAYAKDQPTGGCDHSACVSTTHCSPGNFGTTCVWEWDDGMICATTVACP